MDEIDLEALVNEADQLLEQKDYDLAKKIYLEAGEKGEPMAFLKLGDLYHQEGFPHAAKKYFEKAYLIEPYNKELMEKLKARGFSNFDLDSFASNKIVKGNNKYNKLSNNKLMKRHWFSKDLEACASTLWLVSCLLALIIIIPAFILLLSSSKNKLINFLIAVISSIIIIISGWVAKIVIMGFGVVVRNQEDEINKRKASDN